MVAALAALVAAFLVGRRRIGAAVTLAVGTALALGAGAIVRASESRIAPPGAVQDVSGSSFPSPVAIAAVVWVAVAVAVSPAVRRCRRARSSAHRGSFSSSGSERT